MKNSVERLLYIALALLFTVTSIGVYFLVLNLHQNKEQTATNAQLISELKRSVEELKADKAQRDAVIIHHVDCIGLLMSQQNWGTLYIKDLDSCRILGAGQVIVPPTPTPTPTPVTTSSNSSNSSTPSSSQNSLQDFIKNLRKSFHI